jgi:hypothetical protein
VPLALSIEGRTEFEDASADGFDRDGEGQHRGIVEKQDDPVEFAFAGATRESKPEGMEEIAATNLESFFKVSHNVLEPVGVERLRVEKEESELADDVAGGVTSEDRVGIRRPHDARGVIGKDQLKQISEADEVVGMVAEKRGGTFAPGELPRSRISREPMALSEDGQDLGPGVGVNGRGLFGDVVVGGHGASLARMVGGKITSDNLDHE